VTCEHHRFLDAADGDWLSAIFLTSLRMTCADSGYREAGRALARQVDALVRC